MGLLGVLFLGVAMQAQGVSSAWVCDGLNAGTCRVVAQIVPDATHDLSPSCILRQYSADGKQRDIPCPEALDVPAYLETRECIGFDDECGWKKGHKQVWTCADKSRILLTAEDGTKHCIKFRQ